MTDQPFNWKPWQTSPFLVGFLLAVAAAVVGVLEHLAQISAIAPVPADLHQAWIDWYSLSPNNSVNTLSPLSVPFDNVSDCIAGAVGLGDVAGGSYFAWIFMPSLLAALMAVAWGVVDAEVKRIEPFYQASRSEGAKAGVSIFAEYIDLPSFLSPFQAIYWRQWVVLLSATCYLIICTITPVLQSQLFQVQIQLLQVGYNDSFGDYKYISSISADVDYWNSNDRPPLTGRCLVVGDDWPADGITMGQVLSKGGPDNELYQYDAGALRGVMYVDPAISRAQEAMLLLSVTLGAILMWKLISRKSGMSSSLGSLAALASVAGATPEFLRTLGKRMDIDRSAATRWSKALAANTVHLGLQPLEASPASVVQNIPKEESDRSPPQQRAYSFYFEQPVSDLPEPVPRDIRQPRQPRAIRPAMRLTFLLGVVGIVLCCLLGALGPNTGLTSVSDAQRPAMPIIVLVVSAVMKSTWKVVEQTFLAVAPLCRPVPQQFTPPVRGQGAPLPKEYQYLRPIPIFGREYGRMPPGWITIVLLRDGQYFLGILTWISLCLEFAVLFLGVAATMSLGQGYSSGALFRIAWVAFAFLLNPILLLGALWRIIQLKLPMLLPGRSPGSIAGLLGYVAHSPDLLDDLAPVADLKDEKSRMEYLQSLNGLYGYSPIHAIDLTDGFTYGLAKID